MAYTIDIKGILRINDYRHQKWLIDLILEVTFSLLKWYIFTETLQHQSPLRAELWYFPIFFRLPKPTQKFEVMGGTCGTWLNLTQKSPTGNFFPQKNQRKTWGTFRRHRSWVMRRCPRLRGSEVAANGGLVGQPVGMLWENPGSNKSSFQQKRPEVFQDPKKIGKLVNLQKFHRFRIGFLDPLFLVTNSLYFKAPNRQVIGANTGQEACGWSQTIVRNSGLKDGVFKVFLGDFLVISTNISTWSLATKGILEYYSTSFK